MSKTQHWQEDNEEPKKQKVSSSVVDLGFRVNCPCLPLDHSWLLKQALQPVLPWLHEEPQLAIHDIHGAESGSGWIRPSEKNARLYLSQRTPLYIRTPVARIADVQKLENSEHAIAGEKLVLGKSRIRRLVAHPTLFVRYCPGFSDDEDELLDYMMDWLKSKDIHAPRILCGKKHQIYTPKNQLKTCSILVDGLQADDSLWLQEHGIGDQQLLGCGIFIPHKGIDAVYRSKQN